MWTLLVEMALCADTEIVVYGNRFSTFDDTRWRIQVEMVLPFPILVAAELNHSLRVRAFIADVVLQCNLADVLGKDRREVSCVVQDVAVDVVTAPGDSKKLALGVVQDLDGGLTGAPIELQVNDTGSIQNVGINRVADNPWQQARMESHRQILKSVVAPLDLKLPEYRDGARWFETSSMLFAMPSLSTPVGAQTLGHVLSEFQGNWLVQTIGSSVVYPNPDTESVALGAGQGGMAEVRGGTSASWLASLDGVSVYDNSDGSLLERVFAVHGEAGGGGAKSDWWYSGRVDRLDSDEVVTLTTSRVVAFPGAKKSGLPPWRSINR